MSSVEEDALDQRDHAARAVEAGAHDADLKDLALRNAGLLLEKNISKFWNLMEKGLSFKDLICF